MNWEAFVVGIALGFVWNWASIFVEIVFGRRKS
jgi:hypothetical protein